MGESVKCVGGQEGNHVCDCEGDGSVSLCEHREGPLLFSPQHPQFSGLGKEAGERGLHWDETSGS